MLTTTRKGLPVAQITDTAGSTSVATGRGTTTTGVIRDSVDTISTIADYFTDYDKDEVITGRWEFQSPAISDKGFGQLFVNGTGGARVAGDVVMLDPATDSGIIQPNVAAVSAAKVGVVAEAIAGGAVGRVAWSGFIRVKVLAGVTRGQYLQTQNASNVASGSTYASPGTFAIAMTNPDGANTVLAALHHASANFEGGGAVNGNLTISGSLSVGTATIQTNTGLYVNSVVNAASGLARSIGIDGSLVAQANNDVLYGLLVQPAFNDNGKTGVIHWAGYFAGSLYVAGNLQTGGALVFGAASAIIIPGVTQISFRNNANTADNLLIADNGVVTHRNSIIISSGNVSLASGQGLSSASATDTLRIQPGGNLAFDVVGVASPVSYFSLTNAAAGSNLLIRGAGTATSISFRNNANSADNLIISDSGTITFRGGLKASGARVATATPDTMTTSDYFVIWNYGGAGVANLPAPSLGLTFYIKNVQPAQTLLVKSPSGVIYNRVGTAVAGSTGVNLNNGDGAWFFGTPTDYAMSN